MSEPGKAAWKSRAAFMKKEMKGGKLKMDCEKVLCERLKDAEGALKNGYNEQAEFDAALISVVLGLCDKGNLPKASASKVENTAGVDYFDLSVNEMKSAEYYFSLYQAAGDNRFLNMAKQKLVHSAALSSMLGEGGAKKDSAVLDGKRQQLEKVIR